MPAIATIALFTMVAHWNSWFDGLVYMTDSSNYPLATFLQKLLVQQDLRFLRRPEDVANLTNRTVKAAQIFIAMIPVLLVYPYLQRYFVKGIILGAVKE
jgi:putative aldouronate transport system permease protein